MIILAGSCCHYNEKSVTILRWQTKSASQPAVELTAKSRSKSGHDEDCISQKSGGSLQRYKSYETSS